MRSVITVREQLVEVNGRIVAGAPKTQSGVRVVEIGERVIEALHLRGRDRPALSYVTKLLGKLVRAAGVRPVRLHDLRTARRR
ncbi:MAG TPA: hypothetical protein VGN19_09345 [Pedococcus sp.]|nr:hypothetical protein [Pedococcus sp.]